MHRETLLVDGYNVLGYLGQMNDGGATALADHRDVLIHRLDDYCGYTGCECVLVFDGHHARKNPGMQLQIGGSTVVYTKSNLSADRYIEKLTGLLIKQGKVVRVASGDALEQSLVFSLGALRMPVRELLEDMQSIVEESKRYRHSGDRNRMERQMDAAAYAHLENIRQGKEGDDAV